MKQKEKDIGPEHLRQMERMLLLQTIDAKWKDHLYAMDQLKEGIGLRSFAQREPIIEYKREGFEMFQTMYDSIHQEVTEMIFKIQRVDPSARMRSVFGSVPQKLVHDEISSLSGQRPPIPSVMPGARNIPGSASASGGQPRPRPRLPSTIPNRRSGATTRAPAAAAKIQEMLRTINVSMIDLWLLRAVTGISAFLLFQIELVIAKIFLPYYGGSYLVWGPVSYSSRRRCWPGIFFAHGLIQKYGMRRYRWAHLFLILLPLLFFPGRPLAAGPAGYSLPLALDVFLRLCATIGPVFFVLSTVSVVSQMWLCASSLSAKV